MLRNKVFKIVIVILLIIVLLCSFISLTDFGRDTPEITPYGEFQKGDQIWI